MQQRTPQYVRIFAALCMLIIAGEVGYVAVSAWDDFNRSPQPVLVPIPPTPPPKPTHSATFHDKVDLKVDLETAMNCSPETEKKAFAAWERIAAKVPVGNFPPGEPGTTLLFLGRMPAPATNAHDLLVAIELATRQVGDSPGFGATPVLLIESCVIDPSLGLVHAKRSSCSLKVFRYFEDLHKIHEGRPEPANPSVVIFKIDYHLPQESKSGEGSISATLSPEGFIKFRVVVGGELRSQSYQ